MPNLSAVMRRLGRDYAYVLTGLPIAVFSFSLLLTLLLTSVATIVVWVGALLLPLTLVVATGFAEISRARMRRWGAEPEHLVYRRAGHGLLGRLNVVTDPRRWLDLVFEMLIALPMRLLTWVVAVVWTVLGVGGISYFFWSRFLPDEEGQVIRLLRIIMPSAVPEDQTWQYLLDAGLMLILGVGVLAAAPLVIHGLAQADAALTAVLLSAGSLRTEREAHTQGEPHTPLPSSRHQVLRSFSGRAWSWIGSGFATVVLLAVGWPVIAAVYGVSAAVAMVVVLAHCAAIVITLRWTWIGLAVSLVASGATVLVTAESSVAAWPWPVTTMITQCAVLIVAALARPWYYSAAAWAAGAPITVAALLVSAPDMPVGALPTSIVFISVSATVVLIGALVRVWVLNAGRLEEAARTSEEQGRRRHELEERNRIAREMHDVVAHSMSVISVQAATAQYRNPDIDEAARREFDEIAESSRQALSEMRMLLTIMRDGDEAPTAPEPGLGDMASLIEASRSSGTHIRYSPDDALADLAVSSSTGLIAYRTVQEALSNALRHAPGAVIDVEVVAGQDSRGREQLHLAVINSAAPQQLGEPAPGAGFGLEGIRERAEAVGGTVEAEPTDDGGFAVRATLPV